MFGIFRKRREEQPPAEGEGGQGKTGEKWEEKPEEKPRVRQPSVTIKDSWEKSAERYAAGVLVEVRDGKGCLREVYGETEEASYLTLLFHDQTLLQLQGDEYFCPTCEKMLKSGYGLEQTQEFWQNRLNEDLPFAEAVEGIKPILGLLKSGYYVVVETQLCPTDGHGHLFCEVPNEEEYVTGTCIYYYGIRHKNDCAMWGNNRPYFTVATEPKAKLRQERIAEYRERPRGRALAYYMDGYMTALLDGHHKAMAAAQRHQKVPALVIIPAYCTVYREENGEMTKAVSAGEFCWNCAPHHLEYSLQKNNEKIDADAMQQIVKSIPAYGTIAVDEKGKELAGYYPTVDEMASLDLVGEITDQRIQDILEGREVPEEEETLHYIRALVVLKHDSLLEVADFFLKQYAYCRKRYAIVKELTRLAKSDALVNFLIRVMVDYEEDYPEIKDLILDYL